MGCYKGCYTKYDSVLHELSNKRACTLPAVAEKLWHALIWRKCECWLMLTLRRLAMTCRRRLMLTGTPLQNDLEELQNLLSFLLPDVFQADVAAQLAGEQVRAGQHHLLMWRTCRCCDACLDARLQLADGQGLALSAVRCSP